MKGTIVRRVQMSVLGAGALALAVAGCSPASDAERIASDACDVLEALMEGDMDALADLEDLDRRADEAGVSDEEMLEALESQCGDLMEEMGGAF